MQVRYQMGLVFLLCVVVIWVATRFTRSQQEELEKREVPFLQADTRWADSLLKKLSLEEKIGQMLMVVADADTIRTPFLLTEWMKRYHTGAVAYKNYSASQQFKRSQLYQAYSRLPLLIASYSPNTSLDLIQIPQDYQLAALAKDSIIPSLAQHVASQALALGVHLQITKAAIHQADIVDQHYALAYQIQQGDILSCLYYTNYPIADKRDSLGWARMTYPFLQQQDWGISAMMLDSSLLNRELLYTRDADGEIQSELRNNFKYQGLVLAELPDSVVSDLAVYYQVREMMRAGVDLIVVRDQVPQVVAVLHDLIQRNLLSESQINDKVRKILRAKTWAKAPQHHHLAQQSESQKPYTGFVAKVNQQISESSVSVIRDTSFTFPILAVDKTKPYLLNYGEPLLAFTRTLKRYAPLVRRELAVPLPNKALKPVNVWQLRGYSPVIISLNGVQVDPERDKNFLASIERLRQYTTVAVAYWGGLPGLAPLSKQPQLLHAYHNDVITQRNMAQLIYGGIASQGRLPINVISVTDTLASGAGVLYPAYRLGYSAPEYTDMRSDVLARIDTLIANAIKARAFPGCQILVAHKNKVVLSKAFGHHTYSRIRRVQLSDLYDIASLTKVAATTLAIMRLKDEGKIELDAPLGNYFQQTLLPFPLSNERTMPPLSLAPASTPTASGDPQVLPPPDSLVPASQMDSTQVLGDSLPANAASALQNLPEQTLLPAPIFEIPLSDLLTHHSGLPASLPILPFVSPKNPYRVQRIFKRNEQAPFTHKVAGDFFMRQDLKDSLVLATKYLSVYRNKSYRYSDANMVLLQWLTDSLTQVPFDQWLDSIFYKPLGTQHLQYRPREAVITQRLIPTENDYRWRKQLLRGYVHDPTAALLGGVAGNAGLFSNAEDLAILLQMLLNSGEYGGQRYLSPATIETFSQRQQGHRGYGFDMPPLDRDYIIASSASPNSFGHTGFTGTCFWVDPEEELIFVFLSNRVHPRSNNWKINKLRVRERVHQLIYDALAPISPSPNPSL